MVATINKTNFGGAQFVTCFSCHHGRLRPTTTIALDTLYSAPNEERDDIVAVQRDGPSADKILDRYIEAMGGAHGSPACRASSRQGPAWVTGD